MSHYEPDPDADPFAPKPQDGAYPPMVPPQTSGAAIASLVFGLLFCLPMIHSVLAVGFGFAGIRRTRNPYIGGRGMAISGLILGVVGTGFWLVAFSGFYVLMQSVIAEQTRAASVADGFFKDLSEGKIDAALARRVPGSDRAQLVAAAESLKAAGPFNEIIGQLRPIPLENGEFRWTIDGQAEFSRDTKRFRMSLSRDGDEYKIDQFAWK